MSKNQYITAKKEYEERITCNENYSSNKLSDVMNALRTQEKRNSMPIMETSMLRAVTVGNPNSLNTSMTLHGVKEPKKHF